MPVMSWRAPEGDLVRHEFMSARLLPGRSSQRHMWFQFRLTPNISASSSAMILCRSDLGTPTNSRAGIAASAARSLRHGTVAGPKHVSTAIRSQR